MSVFGIISYGTASLAFIVLLVMLLTSWKGRATGRRLITAVSATALWAAGMALQAWQPDLPLIVVLTFEILRDGAWLGALVMLGRGVIPQAMATGSRVLWISLLAGSWILAILDVVTVNAPGPDLLLVPSGIAMALAVVVLLEQLYRNAGAAGRHALKYLVIGLGGVFAYDLFLYSQAALLDGVAAVPWFARGLVSAMLVPFIAVAARRNPQWSLDIFVSRQAVLFTTTVIGTGLYLLLMAFGGYYVRELGGTWGVAANILFLAGALAVLAIIIASGSVRRRVRVFLSKHFFRNKYDYRIEWLRFVDTLSAEDEPDVRRTGLRAIAQIFDSPGSVMFLKEGTALAPAAAWPMPLENLPDLRRFEPDCELVQFVASRQWVVDLVEYAQSPESYQNIAVPVWLSGKTGIRMVVPMMLGRELLGLVLLFAPPDPFESTYEDRDLLKTLGRHVATLVARREADRRLAESRQFETYHRLTAFMMHDLKNAIAQLQLVVSNAERHKSNPAFIDDMLLTIGNAVARMNGLIGQLRDSRQPSSPQEADLGVVLERASLRCADRMPRPVLIGERPSGVRICANVERLSTSLEHVIRNAQDASQPDGRVEIDLTAADGRARIVIADSGEGMTSEFLREHLFRPFDSTKGSKGMGIGAYQAREYFRSVGGNVDVHSAPGQGTRFEIHLPLAVAGQNPP